MREVDIKPLHFFCPEIPSRYVHLPYWEEGVEANFQIEAINVKLDLESRNEAKWKERNASRLRTTKPFQRDWNAFIIILLGNINIVEHQEVLFMADFVVHVMDFILDLYDRNFSSLIVVHCSILWFVVITTEEENNIKREVCHWKDSSFYNSCVI